MKRSVHTKSRGQNKIPLRRIRVKYSKNILLNFFLITVLKFDSHLKILFKLNECLSKAGS